MRMRCKKNLDERLAACGDIFLAPRCEQLHYDLPDATEPVDLNALFGRTAPLVLEIGSGRGHFAREFARQNPDINVLGVEKCRNVLVEACEKTKAQKIGNLKYLCCAAEDLGRLLPAGKVTALYLNFSTPFQKNSYADHRLTAPRFLKIYRELLTPGAVIFQKTDNAQLFEYSLLQFSQNGYALKAVSLNYHATNPKGNIVTEYEARFLAQQLPIYYLEAVDLAKTR